MRHKKSGRKLNRSGPHRQAMLANMAASLLQHERVVTTPQKAKEVRRFVERLVTLARKGGLSERRRAMAMLKHKTIEGVSAKGNITSVNATKKLFEEIGPRFRDRFDYAIEDRYGVGESLATFTRGNARDEL